MARPGGLRPRSAPAYRAKGRRSGGSIPANARTSPSSSHSTLGKRGRMSREGPSSRPEPGRQFQCQSTQAVIRVSDRGLRVATAARATEESTAMGAAPPGGRGGRLSSRGERSGRPNPAGPAGSTPGSPSAASRSPRTGAPRPALGHSLKQFHEPVASQGRPGGLLLGAAPCHAIDPPGLAIAPRGACRRGSRSASRGCKAHRRGRSRRRRAGRGHRRRQELGLLGGREGRAGGLEPVGADPLRKTSG